MDFIKRLNSFFNSISGTVSFIALVASIFALVGIIQVYNVKKVERARFLQIINDVKPLYVEIQKKASIIKEIEDIARIRENADFILSDATTIDAKMDSYNKIIKEYFIGD